MLTGGRLEKDDSHGSQVIENWNLQQYIKQEGNTRKDLQAIHVFFTPFTRWYKGYKVSQDGCNTIQGSGRWIHRVLSRE